MAITKLRQNQLDARQEARLRKAIMAELKRPDDDLAPANRPIIYQEESGTPERYTHWYVVWHDFEDVDNGDRSRIILDAVEEVFGREAALRVTTAMGLVPDEPLAKDLAEQAAPPSASAHKLAVREEQTKYKTGRKRSP